MTFNSESRYCNPALRPFYKAIEKTHDKTLSHGIDYSTNLCFQLFRPRDCWAASMDSCKNLTLTVRFVACNPFLGNFRFSSHPACIFSHARLNVTYELFRKCFHVFILTTMGIHYLPSVLSFLLERRAVDLSSRPGANLDFMTRAHWKMWSIYHKKPTLTPFF